VGLFLFLAKTQIVHNDVIFSDLQIFPNGGESRNFENLRAGGKNFEEVFSLSFGVLGA